MTAYHCHTTQNAAFRAPKTPYFCENGAFGAWHYFHDLHMSPPLDNQSKIPDRRSSDRLQQHMDERFDALEKLIKSGFPDGNPEEHRKAHERRIKEAKEKEEVKLAVKKSLYSSGIWLALLTLVAALASYLGIEVRK